jgi:hypothetical protein
MFIMALDRLVLASPRPGLPMPFTRRSTARSLWAVEQRLASAERELRIQFTRIAQLQAELDLFLGSLRREADAHAMSLNAECRRLEQRVECRSGR